MATVRRVARTLRHEIDKIKGSRFLATVAPISDRGDAEARLAEIREEFRDATHNCYAWRLATGSEDFRYSDDGEPSGTAGRPILQEIDGRRLSGVAVVVTRYYGGTKLGTGGLLRAYGGAAAEALDLAEVVETRVTSPLRLAFSYDLTGPVQGVLAAHGLEAGGAEYGADVRMELAVPVEDLETVRRNLVDATTGRIRLEG
ncbi:MAG: YigZ family protein [Acidobacteriota bacterium]